MKYTVTIIEDHYNDLKNHLLREDGHERVAYVILGRSYIKKNPWTKTSEERFLSREIIPFPDDELMESSHNRVTWNLQSYVQILKKIEEKDFAIALIHNHPKGAKYFSSVDDANEPEFFKVAFNRNESTRPHLSLIMTADGDIIGRAWDKNINCTEVDFIRILGERFKFFYPKKKEDSSSEIFHRQQLAFGKALVQDFSKLTIGIVGCGATGSATAILLARLGIGNLLLIDKDTVEATNLNRLHGATIKDIGKLKVKVLKKHIESMGLGTKVYAINDWVTSNKCFDALRSCDIIFGCTDDNAGRFFLNRFAYFYLVPIIDMGLTISVTKNDVPQVQDLNGRLTVLFPNTSCLICNEVINSDIAYAENLKRNDPTRYKQLKEEAYVIGEGNPNPAVVTFTTEVACMAVNEFIHRMQGYRSSGSVNNRIRLFQRDTDLTPENASRDECRICKSKNYWGRGDMKPLLDMII